MTKSINFSVSLSKEEVEKIIRVHIIDTYDPEDEDFKNAAEFESEDYLWDTHSDKEFCQINLLINSNLRKPLKKGK